MQFQLSVPRILNGSIQLPASKSISNRALILHALAHGKQTPKNLSNCDDTQVMIRALSGNSTNIDIMAAGTAMRFLTAYFSTIPGTRILTGTQRMQQRPIRILIEALRSLGAAIEYVGNEGFPPLQITGSNLKSNHIDLPGNVSSQYISALLMIGATLPEGLRLTLIGDIISRPYINLTLKMMSDFGAHFEWISPHSIQIHAGGYQDINYTVESDWSAASYWYQMIALLPNLENEKQSVSIELKGLYPNSYQGDCRGAEIFTKLGVHTEYTRQGVRLTKTPSTIKRLDENMIDIPDLAQTFVVTCCLKGIPFCISGLQSLKIKETDRITALITELHKLGYVVKNKQDSILIWEGERCQAEISPTISTYDDHRMAMAFAPIAIIRPQIIIDHPEVVSKSYPCYWEDLQKVGFQINKIGTTLNK
ncbi:MAG: 3-phosphoshikimate 1-carboxyvinyltransferase [Mediterranea massiliensis]|nr:3-phosphoshikimate 1-carboxyvinyltransferase [Mediterranea massiliensis]